MLSSSSTNISPSRALETLPAVRKLSSPPLAQNSPLTSKPGLPNARFFPYDTLEASVALPERWKPTPNHPNDPEDAADKLAKTSISGDKSAPTRVLVPHASGEADLTRKIDLTTALQYGTAQGYPPLYTFLRQFTRENLHPNIPYMNGPGTVIVHMNAPTMVKSE